MRKTSELQPLPLDTHFWLWLVRGVRRCLPPLGDDQRRGFRWQSTDCCNNRQEIALLGAAGDIFIPTWPTA
jgi:hypothetical protein